MEKIALERKAIFSLNHNKQKKKKVGWGHWIFLHACGPELPP